MLKKSNNNCMLIQNSKLKIQNHVFIFFILIVFFALNCGKKVEEESDLISPTGSIKINNDAEYTNKIIVSITSSASDDKNVSKISLNNIPSIANWEAYSMEKQWTLTAGNGAKYVYAWFMDKAGNISKACSDSIILDTTSPTIFSIIPLNNIDSIYVTTNITITFSEKLESSSINTNSIILKKDDVLINGKIIYDSTVNSVKFIPIKKLDYLTNYTFLINTEIKDLAGNNLVADYLSNFTTEQMPPQEPFAPTGLSVLAGDKQVTLSWDNNSDALSYNIYWSKTSGSTNDSENKIINAINPYTHKDLINGTTYYYIVTAVNAYGESLASEEVSATPDNTFDIIPPDTSITGQSDNLLKSNSAAFTFASNEEGSIFECQIDDSGYSATTSPKIYAGLLDGTHTFSVRAKDAAGNVDPTPATYTWTIDTIAPTNSTTISAYNNISKTNTLISNNLYNYFNPFFEWSGAYDNGSGIAGYYVYFGTLNTADPVAQGTFQTIANYTVNNTLISGNTYYLLIKVKDNNGNISSIAYNAFIYNFDFTFPTVSSVNPKNTETFVPINSTITAKFSKLMDKSTINSSTFIINGLTGVVTFNDTTATFTPSIPLVNNINYIATLTTGIKDKAGNAIIAKYSWTFTTVPTTYLMGGYIQGQPLDIDTTCVVNTFAGTSKVFGLKDGFGDITIFFYPYGLTTDGTNMFVGDAGNKVMRKIVLSTAEVTTIAGIAGVDGSSDGFGTSATFKWPGPNEVTTDGINVYTTDTGNHTIRKVVIATGEVITIAGSASIATTVDGIGVNTGFNFPRGITTDGINLYIADDADHVIRKMIIATGEVTTIAGSVGQIGSQDGIGINARFNNPYSITTDRINLFISDCYNHTIRKLVIATGEVTTIAGTVGQKGSKDGMGLSAQFYYPRGLVTDGMNLFVIDTNNQVIRKIVLSTGAVSTIAGTMLLKGMVNGIGLKTKFNGPVGITTDGTSLFVSDSKNHIIRRMRAPLKVISSNPENNSMKVSVDSLIKIKFNKKLDTTTIIDSIFTLNNGVATGTLSCNDSTLTFIPANKLLPETVYTAVIKKGLKSKAGNEMTNNYTFSFTTNSLIYSKSPIEDTMIDRDWNSECGKNKAKEIEYNVGTRMGINRFTHVLMKFDLSDIPSGSVITQAKLRIYIYNQGEYKDNYFNVSRLTENWADINATWCKRTLDNSWQSSGGTWTNEGQSSVIILNKYGSLWHEASGPYNEWIEWNVTDIAKAWIENKTANYGIVIHQTDIPNDSEGQGVAFYSTDYSDETYRPQLYIEYK